MAQDVLGVKAPKGSCTDRKCPFHGEINVKRELFRGVVIRKDINRSATIEWFRPFYVPKFERYEIRRSRMRTHNPACLNVEVGWEVLAARTKPLSKTKNHVIIKVLGKKDVVHGEEDEQGEHKKKEKKQKSVGEDEA